MEREKPKKQLNFPRFSKKAAKGIKKFFYSVQVFGCFFCK
jgi:hypothetical protein